MDGTSEYIVMRGTAISGVYDSGYANPADWIWEAMDGGGRSQAGVRINAESALEYAPWWQGISIIAGDVARMPLDIYERTSDDDRKKRRDHPAYELLNRAANGYMSGYTVRETLMAHALSYGNGYAAIERQGLAGRPIAIVPLSPEDTVAKPVNSREVVYETRLPDQSTKLFASRDVLHIRGYGTGLMGYSVFRLARESLGLGLVAEGHASRHFANDARPGVILTHPHSLDKPEADKLLDAWEQRHGANPNRPALAAGGLQVVPMPINNQDSQLLETRKFQRDEVASWLALPPHKLGSDSRLSYNSVEAEERAYVNQTLMRWLRRIEVECDLKLLRDEQKRAWWYVEHNIGAMIQGDFTTQSNVAVALKNAMIITRNEARKTFNLNSVPDGDEFENANTTSDSGSESTADEPSPPTDNTVSQRLAHRELVIDRVRQMTRSECTSLRRLGRGKEPAKAIESLYTRLQGKLSDALEAPLRAYQTVVPDAEGMAWPTASELAARYCEQSRRMIGEVLATVPAGQLPGALSATIEHWTDTRPSEVVEWIMEAE